MNSTEIWVPIPGYEGLYEFSDKGRARSLDRWVTKSNGHVVFYYGKILAYKLTSGYPSVRVSKDGIPDTLHLHRLIGVAFVPNPYNYTVINHLNGIKTDIRPVNLEWTTDLGNNLHAIATGLQNYDRKIKKEDVMPIIKLLKSGKTEKEVANIFKVHYSSIGRINTGMSWSNISGIKKSTAGRTIPKLKEADVIDIKNKMAAATDVTETKKVLMDKYSLHRKTIENIIHKRTWKHIA